MVSAIYALIQGRQSVAWPFTEGEIIDQKEAVIYGSDSTVEYLRPCYKYRVNDEAFTSDTIKIGSTAKGYALGGGNVATRYPLGARVNVYYNPRNPKIATLETGVSVPSVIFGSVFGGFCLWLLVIIGLALVH